jgi:L,D-transpeptidase catalytic domain
MSEARSFAQRIAAFALVASAACGCAGKPAEAARSGKPATAAAQPGAPNTPEADLERERAQKQLDADYPLHGLVTGPQLKVHDKAEPDALIVGYLRVGSRVRLARDPVKTPTCRTGFYRIHPRGYACAGEGIEVADKPPQSELAMNPPAQDAPLPYHYYLVKELKVPEYHRLPSREDQHASEVFLQRYFELKATSEPKAEKLLAGQLPGEVASPPIVRRYLDHNFFVAGAGIEERAFRKFVRTVRGSYVKLAQLEERKGSAFQGVELGAERQLPMAWMVREMTPITAKQRSDGTFRYVTGPEDKPLERLTLLDWAGREHVGDDLMHKLKDGRYIKYWFAAVAEKIARPEGVKPNEPWVHVNLDQQTLVAYQGDTPVYATLVSTGLEGHDTPAGLFEIRAKYVAATMSDIGQDAPDRYSIEDVPWTEYFSGSIALHGAFWHGGFGLRHSHGCVNLSPFDAHRIFNHTWPELPEGWHGISTDQTGLKPSKVYITEKLP